MGAGRTGARGDEGSSTQDPAARFSPWRHVGEYHADWIIELGDLGGVKEAMCVRDRVILLDSSRSMVERRCDLAHAVAHIELRHTDRRNKADEAAAVRYAAKMLIDLEDLARAVEASAGSVDEDAAEFLQVDMETLLARVAHIHPAERGYLHRRLSAIVATGA